MKKCVREEKTISTLLIQEKSNKRNEKRTNCCKDFKRFKVGRKMKIRKLTPKDFNNVVEVFGQKVITYNILKFDKNNILDIDNLSLL